MDKIRFTYLVDGEKIQLTMAEHMAAVDAIEAGRRAVVLRGGLVVLNLAFLKHAKVDEDSLKEEAKHRLQLRGVPTMDTDVRAEIRKVYEDLASTFKTDVKLLA